MPVPDVNESFINLPEQRLTESQRIERLIAKQLSFLRRWDTPLTNSDPASRYVPLKGKLVWTYGLMWSCFFLMLASCIIGGGIATLNLNPMLGPPLDALIKIGALRAPLVRSGEWWRLLWAPFLHAGWFHIAMNFILWWKLGDIVEPDWGFCKTFFIFMISAVSGNLLSATLDPFNVSVGASGGIFGVMGGCIPYVIEYWHTIHQPGCIMMIVIASLVVGLAFGFVPYVDNYAHMGGTLGGILAGFLTISKIEMGTEPTRQLQSRRRSLSTQLRLQLRRAAASADQNMMLDKIGTTGLRHNGTEGKALSVDQKTSSSGVARIAPKELSGGEARELSTSASEDREIILSRNGCVPIDRRCDEDVRHFHVDSSHGLAFDRTSTFQESPHESCSIGPQQRTQSQVRESEGRQNGGAHERTRTRDQRVMKKLDTTEEPEDGRVEVSLRIMGEETAKNQRFNQIDRTTDLSVHPRKSSIEHSTGSPLEMGLSMDMKMSNIKRWDSEINDNLTTTTTRRTERLNRIPVSSGHHIGRPLEHRVGQYLCAAQSLTRHKPERFENKRTQSCSRMMSSLINPKMTVRNDDRNNINRSGDDLKHDGSLTMERMQQQPDSTVYHTTFSDPAFSCSDTSLGRVHLGRRIQENILMASEPFDTPARIDPYDLSNEVKGGSQSGTAIDITTLPPTRRSVGFVSPLQNRASEKGGDFESQTEGTSNPEVPSNSHKFAHDGLDHSNRRLDGIQSFSETRGELADSVEQCSNWKGLDRLEKLWDEVRNTDKKVASGSNEKIQRPRVPSRWSVRDTQIESVDDSFDWRDWKVWTVRISALIMLIAFWYPLIYYLFICPKCYTPPGQIIALRDVKLLDLSSSIPWRFINRTSSNTTSPQLSDGQANSSNLETRFSNASRFLEDLDDITSDDDIMSDDVMKSFNENIPPPPPMTMNDVNNPAAVIALEEALKTDYEYKLNDYLFEWIKSKDVINTSQLKLRI